LHTGGATQTGQAVLKLQKVLPRAKVLYSSATGASEPYNLAYMVRLGTFGFTDMQEMIGTLQECAPMLPLRRCSMYLEKSCK
jgi:hypothetical protein